MTESDVVDAVNFATFVGFWMLLFVGTASTIARVAYYRAHRFRRPRLLNRDAIMIGGFAMSFGLVLLVRVLRGQGVDVTFLATSLWWTILTSAPALFAVITYVWYEVAVIERGGDHERDATFLDPPRPDDHR